jgi:hypothetical protein
LSRAQHEIAGLFAYEAEYAIENEVAFKAAVEKRYAAGKRLMQALQDRDGWPDPDMGEG